MLVGEGHDVVVALLGAVDDALDGVAGVVDDDYQWTEVLLHHVADLLRGQHHASVAGDKQRAASRTCAGGGLIEEGKFGA